MKTYFFRSNTNAYIYCYVLATLLLVLLSGASGSGANAQSLTYGIDDFDLSNGATAEVVLDLSLQGDNPRDLTFSTNGLNLFTVGSTDQEINHYTLSKPYDLSTANFKYSLDVSGEEAIPEGIAISKNGLNIYMVGVNSDTIYQYTMNSASQLMTATLSKKLKISDQQLTASDLAFNDNGTKMFVVGFSNQRVHQYNLSTAFDVTTATVLPNPLDLSNEEITPRGMAFGDSGKKLFIVGSSGKEVNQYSLSTAYDVTTASHDLAFNVQPQENGPQGVTFRPDGTEMFVVGMAGDDVTRYTLNRQGFVETMDNEGAVSGDLTIKITGDTFTNTGSTLTHETDYTIINNPPGLVPSLSVAADGLSATLTYSGQSENHFNTHDIDGLVFTFSNSAFLSGNANAVANAINETSQRGIDYLDNAVLTYGKGFKLGNGATKNNPRLIVENQQPNVQGVTISADGSKLYVIGGLHTSTNKITQYKLNTPFSITNGVVMEGQLDVTSQDEDPMGLKFSPDGRTLFVLGKQSQNVFQYQLTTPFDITGTVVYQGNPFNWGSAPQSLDDLTFSNDGMKMYILESTNRLVYQYTLHAPFDITKGATHDGSPYDIPQLDKIHGIAFNKTGTIMLLAGRSNISQYKLSRPYDITSGVSNQNVSYSIHEIAFNTGTTGIALNTNGSKIYVSFRAAGDDFVRQHSISFSDDFAETGADDGTVSGNMKINITGDTFVNAGGTLVSGTHFSFSNLPSGLVPTMSVSANGRVATLTLAGNATNHGKEDAVGDLELTFTDAAFTNSNAGQVVNAVNASTGSEITFTGQTTLEIQAVSLEQPEGNLFTPTNFSFAVNRLGDISGTTSVSYSVSGDVDASDFFNSAIPSGTVDFTNGQATVVVDLAISGDHTLEPNESFTVTLSNPTNQAVITTATADGTILDDDNSAPSLDNPINDLELFEGFIMHTVDLTNVFSDADGHTLSYAVSSSNPIATIQIVGSEIRIIEGATGTTTVTVTADDGFGGTVSDEFVLTVRTINTPPVIDIPLSDEVLTEGFGTKEIDMDDAFTDADRDPLTHSATSGNTSVVTVSVSGNFLTLTEVGNGTAVVTITADDGNGGTVSDMINVTVAAPNNNPIVVNPIADQNLAEGFTTTIVDLTHVFSDIDEDVLVLSGSSSNVSVATVNISGSDLTLTEAGVGITTITVTADDGKGGSVTDDFQVSVVAAPNTAPVVTNPIADQNFTEGFSSTIIDISNVFSDTDGDILIYSSMNSNDAVATINLSDTDLTITEAGVGTTTVTVTVDDGNGGSVTDDFIVSVSAAGNNVPVVANPINDQNLLEGFTSVAVDLSNVFTDADNDVLSLSATSSNVAVATVSVSGDDLTITEVGVGTTTITVTADDGKGGLASDEFVVSVSAVGNNPPVVANPISDQNLTSGFTSAMVDLTSVFSDADSDVLSLSASTGNAAVATVSVSGTDLTITEVGIGATTISVTADDGNGGLASDEFVVSISAVVNNAPIVANSLDDQSLTAGFTSTVIDLENVFSDVDGDQLSLISSSSDESVVTVAISSTALTITEVGIGTSSITVTADDGNGGSVSAAFDVSVTETQVLGLEDAEEIRVYPNPASQYIMIQTSGVLQGAIYDEYGKIHKTVMSSNRIDISNLKSGIYLIRIITSKGNTVWNRFIKQ